MSRTVGASFDVMSTTSPPRTVTTSGCALPAARARPKNMPSAGRLGLIRVMSGFLFRVWIACGAPPGWPQSYGTGKARSQACSASARHSEAAYGERRRRGAFSGVGRRFSRSRTAARSGRSAARCGGCACRPCRRCARTEAARRGCRRFRRAGRSTVRNGDSTARCSTSSKQTRPMSSGTDRPRSRSACMAPTTVMLLTVKIAVGSGSSASICCAAR